MINGGLVAATYAERPKLRQTNGRPSAGPHVPLTLMATLTRTSSLSPTRALPLASSITS